MAAAMAIPAVAGVLEKIFNKNKQNIVLAKNENAALGQVIPWIQMQIQTVFDAANAGQISETQAIAALTQIENNYWSKMTPLIAGGSAASCGGSSVCKGHACTAGCCVGCTAIKPWVKAAADVFQAGGGTANFVQVFGSPKYGYGGQAAFSLTYRRPAYLSATARNSAQSDLPLSNLPVGNIGTAGINGTITPFSQTSQAGLNATAYLGGGAQQFFGNATVSSGGTILAILAVLVAAGVAIYATK